MEIIKTKEVDDKRINDLFKENPFQFIYKKELLVKQNHKKYIYLERIEFFRKKNGQMKEEYYYDCLFLDGENLIYLLNNRENSFFNNEELNDYKRRMKKSIIYNENVLNFDKLLDSKYIRTYKKTYKYFNIYNKNFKHDYFLNILKKSFIFKNYLVEELNLASFYKNKENIDDLIYAIKYPVLENTWIKFKDKILFEKYFLNLLFKEDELLEIRKYSDFQRLLKNKKIKDLKDNHILFNKKIINLLSSKISYDTNKNENLSTLLLFENENHLATKIKGLQNISILSDALFLEYNVLIKDELILLSIDEIKKMFKEKLYNYADFELFLCKKDFIEVNNHLNDLINMLYKVNYYFKNNMYAPDKEYLIKEFMSKKFNSFSIFENELNKVYVYILSNDEDKKELYIEDKLEMIETKEYYFKQPEIVSDLKYIGLIMNHCVYSYKDELLKENKNRNKNIVILYRKSDDYPLVCLEIIETKENKFECIQSKMIKNKPSKENSKYNNLIISFLEKNSINKKTNDI